MTLFTLALGLLLFGSVLSFLLGRSSASAWAGPLVGILGCSAGFVAALSTLLEGASVALTIDWSLPVGRFGLLLDPLSCLFLLPVFLLGGVAALYGSSSLKEYAGRRNLGAHWAFFILTVLGLALSMAADNVFLFLVAWEIMSIAPLFCITLNDGHAEVRAAGREYLIAAHVGVAFLTAMLLFFAFRAGSLDFSVMGTASLSGLDVGIIFVLALIGFGAKAGIMPMHVWLPKAHPVAPSHVSAFLSGALIKAGLYGLLRVMTLTGPVASWQAAALIVVGLVTAFLGILFALGRQDLKTILAYSSSENIGIMVLGLGVGCAGLAYGLPGLSLLGFAGLFLHVLNHSLMKGLLFLSAGAVLHGAGTTALSSLGGLIKTMPGSAAAFGLGAVAIAGLPPMNGFTGELMIYLGAGKTAFQLDFVQASVFWLAVAGLAVVGGLAVAAMTKAFGLAFLGEPRTEAARKAHDPAKPELVAMFLLAGGCLGMSLGAPFVFRLVLPAVAMFSGPTDTAVADVGARALGVTSLMAAAVLVFIVVGALIRRRVLAGRSVGSVGTWDCGYTAPSARMQYSGGSFAEPLTTLMQPVSGVGRDEDPVTEFFPKRSRQTVTMRDWFDTGLVRPLFNLIGRVCERVHVLQHGKTHLYILSLIGALVVLLAMRAG